MKTCCNAEPGTFGHSCEKPATWLGDNRFGFCADCKEHGYEASGIKTWTPIANPGKVGDWQIVDDAKRQWRGTHWSAWR